jgi:hypothetical protein
MKTRTLLRTSVAIVAGSLFAAAAFAGPGPQFWNRTPAKPVEKPMPVKMNEHPTGKCGGCKTSPNWVVGDRGPAGKGVGLRVAGYTHSCTGCAGTSTTENGKTKTDMKHATGCATLVCCK